MKTLPPPPPPPSSSPSQIGAGSQLPPPKVSQPIDCSEQLDDEPDQTPTVIDGMPGGQAMLQKVAVAKAGCGGLDCVIGGGFLLDSVCQNQPLDGFLAGLPEPAQIAPLPNKNLPAADSAAQMNALLAETLADVIAAKCDEIPPVG
jgi:hypothetical protein